MRSDVSVAGSDAFTSSLTTFAVWKGEFSILISATEVQLDMAAAKAKARAGGWIISASKFAVFIVKSYSFLCDSVAKVGQFLEYTTVFGINFSQKI